MTGIQNKSGARLLLLRVLLIVAAGLWIYSPSIRGEWLMDDELYLPFNSLLHDSAGLWKIWFAPGGSLDYYPIEETVQWVQWHLWHTQTLGYHLTNVVLHIGNGLLVWRLLSKFGLRLAWLGGLLFVVHPVQVESVAWISELKNTLSLLPFLLSMTAWIDYEEHGLSKDYFLALGLFLISTLCKIGVAPFPIIILLYAWWKRDRIGWNDLKAAAPFLVISLTIGYLAILVGNIFLQLHHTHPDVLPVTGFFPRLALGGLTFAFYFSHCFWPVPLVPMYPLWTLDFRSPATYLPLPVLATGVGWFWSKRKSWGRHALLGLGFFSLMVGLFLGLTGTSYMSYMRFSPVMDHFLYIPIIGLIGPTVAALDQVGGQLAATVRNFGIGVLAAALVSMAWESHAYAALFGNQQTLWTYTLRYNPGSWTAHNFLGVALLKEGRISDAIEQFHESCGLKPDFADAHNNLGGALRDSGRSAESIEEYEEALKIKPDFAIAHNNLGLVLSETGRIPEAIGQFEIAVEQGPDDSEVRYNFANALAQANRLPEAMDQYDEALKMNPDFAEAHYSLGNALVQAGRLPEAVAHYEEAVRLKPAYADAHANLGNALLQLGQLPQAIEEYEQALRITPHDTQVRNTLGLVLMKTGRIPEATAQFEAVLQIDPQDANAREGLAKIKGMK